jgi:hypothetical protein
VNKKRIFLIFCTIFVVGGAFSQQMPQNSVKRTWGIVEKKPVNTAFAVHSLPTSPQKQPSPIRPDFYATNLGFFCKQEIKFEKATKISFKFRLGSVQQCDWLEGKRNASTAY